MKSHQNIRQTMHNKLLLSARFTRGTRFARPLTKRYAGRYETNFQ